MTGTVTIEPDPWTAFYSPREVDSGDERAQEEHDGEPAAVPESDRYRVFLAAAIK
jgi:hypothetical protein